MISAVFDWQAMLGDNLKRFGTETMCTLQSKMAGAKRQASSLYTAVMASIELTGVPVLEAK